MYIYTYMHAYAHKHTQIHTHTHTHTCTNNTSKACIHVQTNNTHVIFTYDQIHTHTT